MCSSLVIHLPKFAGFLTFYGGSVAEANCHLLDSPLVVGLPFTKLLAGSALLSHLEKAFLRAEVTMCHLLG